MTLLWRVFCCFVSTVVCFPVLFICTMVFSACTAMFSVYVLEFSLCTTVLSVYNPMLSVSVPVLFICTVVFFCLCSGLVCLCYNVFCLPFGVSRHIFSRASIYVAEQECWTGGLTRCLLRKCPFVLLQLILLVKNQYVLYCERRKSSVAIGAAKSRSTWSILCKLAVIGWFKRGTPYYSWPLGLLKLHIPVLERWRSHRGQCVFGMLLVTGDLLPQRS